MSSFVDRLALSLAPGLGTKNIQRLLEVFGDARAVLDADRATIVRNVRGIGPKTAAGIDKPGLLAAAERQLAEADRSGVGIIVYGGEHYPPQLAAIPDPPAVLYSRGDISLLTRPAIALVGARASSDYGRRIAANLAEGLCRRGLSVVSGLALGIDAAAHAGALRAGGSTIAVLGCGIDVVYPRQNRGLYDNIVSQGVVVSEYRMGTEPEAFRFPARNRIISGLSLGVVVVEAARRSGSLITARLALEQGREVFAIPGRIDSLKSEGSHRLLQEGAKLVHHIDDIVEEIEHMFAWSAIEEDKALPDASVLVVDALSEEEKKVLTLLDVYPVTIDELIVASGLSAQKINELLLLLELKGAVLALPGKQFQRVANC